MTSYSVVWRISFLNRDGSKPTSSPTSGRRSPALCSRGLLVDVQIRNRSSPLLGGRVLLPHRCCSRRPEAPGAPHVARGWPPSLERHRDPRAPPHGGDCETVLARATHKSKRQIEELVAELSPKPDVSAVIRKLPALESSLEVSSNCPRSSSSGFTRTIGASSCSTIPTGIFARSTSIAMSRMRSNWMTVS